MSASDDDFEEQKMAGGKKKMKGRGFKGGYTDDRAGRAGEFESIGEDDAAASSSNFQKSVEGWIVFVTNVHEEAQEDDLYDLFADYGEIKQIHLNLDRRTGYVKGYAMIEYEKYQFAQSACDSLNGHALLEQEINVSFAFTKGGKKKARR